MIQTQPEAPCPYWGVIDCPTLTPGAGPHAVRASCAHCGRFIRWISTLAPAERLARKTKHRLAAMQRRPPTAPQLAYLAALGDRLADPESMAEASERVGGLKAKRSNAPGGNLGHRV